MEKRKRRPTRKDAQREETRRKLIEAARALFREHGFSGVSTTEIARAVGVTHGAIHAHFHSKAGLLFAIIEESNATQHEAAQAAANGPGSPLERLRRVVEIYVRDDASDPELLSVMQAFSWEWPYDFEERNQDSLNTALSPVATILRSFDLDERVDHDRLVQTMFAAYTHALRAILYDHATMEDVVDEVMRRFDLILYGAVGARR